MVTVWEVPTGKWFGHFMLCRLNVDVLGVKITVATTRHPSSCRISNGRSGELIVSSADKRAAHTGCWECRLLDKYSLRIMKWSNSPPNVVLPIAHFNCPLFYIIFSYTLCCIWFCVFSLFHLFAHEERSGLRTKISTLICVNKKPVFQLPDWLSVESLYDSLYTHFMLNSIKCLLCLMKEQTVYLTAGRC